MGLCLVLKWVYIIFELMTRYKVYEDSLKREVVREVRAGLLSKAEAKRKYNIPGSTTVLYWLRNFDDNNPRRRKMSVDKKSSKDLLLRRIQELERQLEDEKIRSEGLSKMIDIAEDQLNVPIRKKSGTKQSRR